MLIFHQQSLHDGALTHILWSIITTTLKAKYDYLHLGEEIKTWELLQSANLLLAHVWRCLGWAQPVCLHSRCSEARLCVGPRSISLQLCEEEVGSASCSEEPTFSCLCVRPLQSILHGAAFLIILKANSGIITSPFRSSSGSPLVSTSC